MVKPIESPAPVSASELHERGPQVSRESSLDTLYAHLPTFSDTPLDARGFRARDHSDHGNRIADLRREAWWNRDHGWISIMCDSGHTSFVPSPCGVRYCDICARSRAVSRRAKLRREIEHTQDVAGPGWRVKVLTLTIENVEDLGGGWDHLLDSFSRFREMRLWRDTGVAWWRASLEVTTKGKEWHPHLHVLMCAGFMDYRAITGSWITATRGWGMITDIREAYGPPGQEAREAAKYVAKPQQVATWSRRQRGEFSRVARDRRSWFGSGAVIGLPDETRAGCGECGSSVELVHQHYGPADHHYARWSDEDPCGSASGHK